MDESASSIPLRVERLRRVLSEWPDVGSNTPEDAHILAATVRADKDGFIAVGHVGDSPVLLCCIGSHVSIELDTQIEACLLARGPAADADTVEYDRARHRVQEWVDSGEASESAGIAVAPPARRKKLLNRIDAALQNAAPHVRASRAAVVARARAVASAAHGAALEHELERFTDSPLPDDEWLNAVAGLAAPRTRPVKSNNASFQLRALLLLKR